MLALSSILVVLLLLISHFHMILVVITDNRDAVLVVEDFSLTTERRRQVHLSIEDAVLDVLIAAFRAVRRSLEVSTQLYLRCDMPSVSIANAGVVHLNGSNRLVAHFLQWLNRAVLLLL